MEAAVAFRFCLATVFILAGLAKLRRRSEFARAIGRYELLPSWLVRPAAAAIPPLELAAGTLLAVGLGTRVVAVALAALLAVFSVAVAINLLRGRSFDCGCFTPGVPARIGWPTLARNSLLIGMAAVVGLEGRGRSVSTTDALALAVVATVAVVALAAAGEGVKIWRLSRSRPILHWTRG